MTTQEYVSGSIRGEQVRVTDMLIKADPTSPEYSKLLDSLHGLCSLLSRMNDDPNGIAIMDRPVCNEDCAVCEEATPDPAASVEQKPAEIVELHPVENPFPEPEAPAAEPAKTYKKEEVRAALGEARKRGVNATELLRSLGYENFTSVPAAEYGTIMAKLEES